MKNNLLAHCSWPDLPEKYDLAVRKAVAFILENYSVVGIIVSGTIIRGNPNPASDLDVYVIHLEPFRQRLQKFFNDVPTEIFINPPNALEKYFKEEQAKRRPITAHMLATGHVVLDLDPIIGELLHKAESLLSQPPDPPKDLIHQKYFPALLFEDAVDIMEQDPEAAEIILYQAMSEMIKFCFIQAGSFIPRQKELLSELAKIDANIAAQSRSFYQAASLKAKMEIAGRIADQTIGQRGFFEWDSLPEPFAID